MSTTTRADKIKPGDKILVGPGLTQKVTISDVSTLTQVFGELEDGTPWVMSSEADYEYEVDTDA